MRVKIYREREKNKKSRGVRGLTLTRIIPVLAEVGVAPATPVEHCDTHSVTVATTMLK
jgi:hypothetical protein